MYERDKAALSDHGPCSCDRPRPDPIIMGNHQGRRSDAYSSNPGSKVHGDVQQTLRSFQAIQSYFDAGRRKVIHKIDR